MINELVRKITVILLMSFSLFSVRADDIDLIDVEQIAFDANILFIMDLSGSMGWPTSASNADNRLTTLKTAMASVLNDSDIKNINFGLSTFAGDTTTVGVGQTANGISYPVSPIDALAETILDQNPLFDHPGTSFLPATAAGETTRDYLQTIAETWIPTGGTPIVDSLFEAALYFRGLPTNWGRHDPSKNRSAHPSTYVGLLADKVITTPGAMQCNTLPCTGSSCNATKVCTSEPDVQTCSTPDCGDVCSGPITVPEVCQEGVVSCGTGLNCSEAPHTVTRNCITNSEFLCRLFNPTYYNCKSVKDLTCELTCPDGELDDNGDCEDPVNECKEKRHQQCKEDINLTSCDADSYQCTTSVERCTHEVCEAGDPTETTVLDGTATFISPIKGECPANGIILLSDGAPTVNLSADLAVDMMGPTYGNNCDTGTNNGRCGVELAKFLANEDHSTDFSGKQNVSVFTVGLSLQNNPNAENYLKEIAKAGEGEFINATSPEALSEAFKLAIDGIAGARARSFSSPTYSIDTSSLLNHDSYVYVPMFDRKGIVWPGNLKKFRVINNVLVDANGNPATDSLGTILSTAKDEWSESASTDAVRSGGVANKINPSTRILLTENSNNDLVSLNETLPNSAFGISGTTTTDNDSKKELLTFIRGINPIDNSVRHHMGDILHSKPVKLNIAGQDSVIFVGTNEGYLHAIKDQTGEEMFAYMPYELIKNIRRQYHRIAGTGHIYGVDGPITLWLDESSNAGTTKAGNQVLDPGEKAYLFFGLRRGGKHYYALDVTVPNAPVLKWKKQFGTADSWSQPVVKNLFWKPNSKVKPVLVFGGGYNESADGQEEPGGNAVYIADALTGNTVWSTKDAESVNTLAPQKIEKSVPSRIRVLDVDRNGSIDRLYFGDTGGNIWRADINAGKYSGNPSDAGDIKKAQLHKLASLGGSEVNNRKFFEEPDVAIFKQASGAVATIAIGSGDRTRPLSSSVENSFFVIYDKEVFSLPTEATITFDKLNKAPVTKAIINATSFRGWYHSLTSSTGEKVLSTATTYQNKVLFTTFGTTPVVVDSCNPAKTNQARFYIMDLITGAENTNVVASTGEILGTPTIVFEELSSSSGGACVKGDCIRKESVRVGKVGPYTMPSSGSTGSDPDILPRVFWIDND